MLRRISVILVSILIMGITPAVAAPVYVFPVAGCKVNYARAHHDYPATDILAKQGCKFVSPIDGVVDEALPVDKQEFKATTYQQYQGEKLAKRFNAYSYWYLSKGMDSHDVGRDRNGVIAALQLIEAKTLVIGVSSDILFPVKEQTILQQHIGNAKLAVIDSYYGHDGFLLEHEKIGSLIKGFLEEELAII